MTIIVTRDMSQEMRHEVNVREHHFSVDGSIEEGGGDLGPSAHDLYDAALASCKALTVVWSTPVVAVVVFVGAVVMGYGARLAGGCTSGHGICGTAQRSPASWAVTATFMATAIVVTALLHTLTGGRL